MYDNCLVDKCLIYNAAKKVFQLVQDVLKIIQLSVMSAFQKHGFHYSTMSKCFVNQFGSHV